MPYISKVLAYSTVASKLKNGELSKEDFNNLQRILIRSIESNDNKISISKEEKKLFEKKELSAPR